MNWEIVKEQSQKWYGKASQFFLFQNLMMYLFLFHRLPERSCGKLLKNVARA